MYGFYSALGIGIFWIGLVVAIILFANYKKIYPVIFLASICLYIFTVGFMIDVFELNKNLILLTLAFSALVFMGLGFYFSRTLSSKPFKK